MLKQENRHLLWPARCERRMRAFGELNWPPPHHPSSCPSRGDLQLGGKQGMHVPGTPLLANQGLILMNRKRLISSMGSSMPGRCIQQQATSRPMTSARAQTSQETIIHLCDTRESVRYLDYCEWSLVNVWSKRLIILSPKKCDDRLDCGPATLCRNRRGAEVLGC